MSEINLHNRDCLEAMREMEDNSFDLAIVDPPYFKELGNPKGFYGNKQISDTGVKRSNFKTSKSWKVPGKEYFDELIRISKNQIIWGCNYYAKHIPDVGRIVWDKKNDSSSFSKAEIASKSKEFGIGTDMFRFMWNGMLQGDMKNKEHRIHPTQKPVKLYEWVLMNYAKEGDTIIDTHCGSGSIMIACDRLGFDLEAFETDTDHYNASLKRFKEQTAQITMF